MNISGIPAVDVLIGLAFLYFLLSTACSAINEAIATSLNWRAKELFSGIRNLLGDDIARTSSATSRALATTTPPPPGASEHERRTASTALAGVSHETVMTAAADNTTRFYSNPRVRTLYKRKRLFEDTRGLRRLPLPNDKKPSYIPSRVFVQTVIDEYAKPVAGAGHHDLVARAQHAVGTGRLDANPRLKGLLQDALDEANQSVEKQIRDV